MSKIRSICSMPIIYVMAFCSNLPLYFVIVTSLCSTMQESGANFFSPSPVTSTNDLVIVWDPEVGRINPSEHKQLKLARSLTRGIIDRDLKPSSNERK